MRSLIFAVTAAAALSAATLFGSVQAAPLTTPAAAMAQQGEPGLVEQVQSRRMNRGRMMNRGGMMRGRQMNRGRMTRSRPMMRSGMSRGRMMRGGQPMRGQRMMRGGRSRMM